MDVCNRTALVLEGGGYRSVFTSGVLDVLMERGITDFASVWGVSAGAINATSFKSRQIGRSIRIQLAFRDDKRLMSFFSLATTGNITGADFLYHTVQEELDPCDVSAFNENPIRMYAVLSDVMFGTPRYLEVKELPRDIDIIRASSSLPLVSMMVELDGNRYLDGGTTDSVPVEAALGEVRTADLNDYEPADQALVVLTRQRDYIKGQQLERIALLSRRYAEFPLYVEALRTRAERYMRQREHIWELERAGKVLALMPDEPVKIATTEHNGQPMLSLYLKGRQCAEQKIGEILDFLK